jgi:hypothetical protein
MSDYIPSSAPNQALGARSSLYASFYIAVTLPGGLLVRVSRSLLAVVRWVLVSPSFLRADQIQGIPPRHIPGLLDPAQVGAVIAALRLAIVHGSCSIPSPAQRWADSDRSGGDDDDEEDNGASPNDRRIWYPRIQSLEVGDARLFIVSGPAESIPPGFTRYVSVRRAPLLTSSSMLDLIQYLLNWLSRHVSIYLCLIDFIPFVLVLVIPVVMVAVPNSNCRPFLLGY